MQLAPGEVPDRAVAGTAAATPANRRPLPERSSTTPGQGRRDRGAGTGAPGQGRRDRGAGTGAPGQGRRDRGAGTVAPRRIARKSSHGHGLRIAAETGDGSTLVTPETLRQRFLTWQCRVRQIAMREDGGRPSAGMRPKILSADGRTLSEGTILLLVRDDPAESTDYFEFQVRKNLDPNEVYQKGLTYLQSTHYHRANRFSDEMTALFLPGSRLAALLVRLGSCRLDFHQFGQSWRLPCAVREMTPDEPAYRNTLWHNRLFNTQLSGDVRIVGFRPDWAAALLLEAD